MEPSENDISQVAAAMSEQPAPQPQATPEPQQPAETPTPQPTQPTQTPAQPAEYSDPFASIFSQPSEPTQPVQTAVEQPVEPAMAPQPAPQPTPAPQPEEPQQMTADEYMQAVLNGVPEAPSQPDPEQVDPNDPNAIRQFFDDLFTTAERRFEANYARKQAFQASERKLWDEAFTKYESLRSNTQLRDMVHAIRRNEFSRGIAVSPTQAADKLLSALKNQYSKGVADNQVITTIQDVQPSGGGGTSVATSLDSEAAMLSIQNGGEEALAQLLDQKFKSQGQ